MYKPEQPLFKPLYSKILKYIFNPVIAVLEYAIQRFERNCPAVHHNIICKIVKIEVN